MNALQFLKNGSGIHIKKKNRGKFTDYCGGQVTQECINKGKHSSNPAVRKRATFAANARKWKHEKGGFLKGYPSKAAYDVRLEEVAGFKKGGKAFVEGVNILDSNPKAYKYVKKKYKMHQKGGNLVTNYIKAIENPNRVGWNGKVWQAPNLKGYDVNQRGYGIDINTNQSAKKLTNGRPGRWITDAEATKLMNDHISYITNAANKHIKGFNKLSPQRQAALLGMLYRGDSVNKSGINYLVGDDKKFFTSIGNYYRSKGLNERANNSDKFFGKYLQKGGSIDWTSTLANVGSSILQGYFQNKQISKEAEAAKAMNKLTSKDFFNIYNQKLQEAKQQEEQQAKAVEAMTGTTINSSNIVAANNAWKNASGEYAELKNNVDQQNRAIDAQAQAQKSNIWGNAISGVMQQGMGLLNNYLNNKSSNATTPTTISTKTSYNYFNTPKKFGTFNNDESMNLGYNMTWSTDKGIQTKKWSDGIFNKSYTDYLK